MVGTPAEIKNRCMPSTSASKLTVKRGIDGLIAVLVVVVLGPLMLAIALAIRLSSPGPALFRQRRIGQGGREFVLYKFRTMLDDPDAHEFELPAGVAPGGVEGQDRRTRIGRWLRATSLDELPQLFNVLRGDMSVVGPRPERPEYAKRFALTVPGYVDRLRVKSGITGWAQANGLRGQTPITDRVAYDNYYIDNWSLGLELRTIALTAIEIGRLRDRGGSLRAPATGRARAPRPLKQIDEGRGAPGRDHYADAMDTKRIALIASIVGSGIVFLDATIVNVALPSIRASLHGGLAVQQWVVEAYLLTLASLLLVGGSLGDLFGRRRVFAIGVVAFGVFSLLCAVAPSSGWLIAGRAIQGIAGALLVPSTLALIMDTFDADERAGGDRDVDRVHRCRDGHRSARRWRARPGHLVAVDLRHQRDSGADHAVAALAAAG